VATLLSLDKTGAFDRVVPAWLLHNTRGKKVPERIVMWVSSFISNTTTTLYLLGYNTDAFLGYTSIP
jgi:hypothetical protein